MSRENVIVRIGGTVQPESEPERELANIARVTTQDEFGEWMRDYHAGNWLLVRVELFAEALGPDGVSRYRDDSVHALSFGVPHTEDNLDHAREVVRSAVDAIAAMLETHGIVVDPEALGALPVAVELGAEVADRLAA
jgi:hypothetical protein